MPRSEPRPSADTTAVLVGVVSIVGGIGTGLFSDLRTPGKVLGFTVLLVWFLAIALILGGRGAARSTRWSTLAAFAVTGVLVVYAFLTGPRLSDRTLVLTSHGASTVDNACPAAVRHFRVKARIALNQLDGQFIHVELEGCRNTFNGADIRLRTEDVRAVLPAS